MANTLSNTGIATGQPVEATQVSQSVDAFTGAEAYDITISGSLTVDGPQEFTGSLNISGSVLASGSMIANEGFTGSLKGDADKIKTTTAPAATHKVLMGLNVPGDTSDILISPDFQFDVPGDELLTTASWANSASWVSSSGVYGPDGFDTIESASYALSSSYAVTSSHAEEAASFTGTINADNVNQPFATLEVSGNTDLGDNNADITQIQGTTKLTGSLLLSASLPGNSTGIDMVGALSASNADGSMVTILSHNDLKFNRSDNVSYIHQLGSGDSKLQIGLGTGTGTNAHILISGSGGTQNGNAVHMMRGAVYNNNPNSAGAVILDGSNSPVLTMEGQSGSGPTEVKLKIKPHTFTTVTSNFELVKFIPQVVIPGALGMEGAIYIDYILFAEQNTYTDAGVFTGGGAYKCKSSGDPRITILGSSFNNAREDFVGTYTANIAIVDQDDSRIAIRFTTGATDTTTVRGIVTLRSDFLPDA